MLLSRFLVAVLLTSFSVSPALAIIQTPEPEPPEVVVEGKIPDANKRVCKSEGTTGSIIPKRVCRTKGEWEEIRARSLAIFERKKADQQSDRHTKAMLENQ